MHSSNSKSRHIDIKTKGSPKPCLSTSLSVYGTRSLRSPPTNLPQLPRLPVTRGVETPILPIRALPSSPAHSSLPPRPANPPGTGRDSCTVSSSGFLFEAPVFCSSFTYLFFHYFSICSVLFLFSSFSAFTSFLHLLSLFQSHTRLQPRTRSSLKTSTTLASSTIPAW